MFVVGVCFIAFFGGVVCVVGVFFCSCVRGYGVFASWLLQGLLVLCFGLDCTSVGFWFFGVGFCPCVAFLFLAPVIWL